MRRLCGAGAAVHGVVAGQRQRVKAMIVGEREEIGGGGGEVGRGDNEKFDGAQSQHTENPLDYVSSITCSRPTFLI